MRKATRGGESAVRTAARRAGVMDAYVDGLGTPRVAPVGAVEALHHALGVKGGEEAVAVVARMGSRAIRLNNGASKGWRGRVELEDGGAIEIVSSDERSIRLAERLPLGVHRVTMAKGTREHSAHVLASPAALQPLDLLGGKRLAVFMPLHALSSPRGMGVGTISDLADLVTWAERTAHGFVGTLPMFPAFYDQPFDPSPYAPISRQFWNELFVDVQRAEEWNEPAVRQKTAALQSEIRACRKGRWVDYRRSWRVMRQVLAMMASAARKKDARWSAIQQAAGEAARGYARFRAGVDATGVSWQDWKASWQRGRIPAGAVDEHAVDLYLYAQALANEQMRSIAGGRGHPGSPLYLDLPVGVHGGGYDVWREPDLFLSGASAGAPPDGLHSGGQVWGFPPMHPTAGRRDGYAHLRAIMRRMIEVAGVVRIDHVMWLERMYCVMPGFGGDEGAYVRYPMNELIAVMMIEAARGGAVVVGEDLGTVTDSMRSTMRARGMLGMHVQQFGLSDRRRGAVHPSPPHCLASLNTHDTPTFAGYWSDADIALRQRLGHVDNKAANEERRGRAPVRAAVSKELKEKGLGTRGAQNVARSLMRMQARGDAPITLVNLEDVWGETEPQNVPGTLDEYPNWRRRAGHTVVSITQKTAATRVLTELVQERGRARRQRSGRCA